MTDPSERMVDRGQAIFERLRAGNVDAPDGQHPDEDASASRSDDPDTSDADARSEADSDPAVPASSPDDRSPGASPAGEDDQVATQPSIGVDATGTDMSASSPDGDGAGAQPQGGPANDRLGGAGGSMPPLVSRGIPGPADLAELIAGQPSSQETSTVDTPAQVPDPSPAPVAAAEPTASPFARELPRIMAIANQKGGVGKTTTAVNLGASLADIGYRVLVVDLDPQGNASTGMGINIRDLQGSMYEVILHDLPIEDCVEATSVRNLFVAPSSLDLAGAEIELVPAFSREQRLKRALDEVRDDYDFVLIDCPPSLGLLTVNGLAAATEVVVPIQCEYYALEGLGQLLRNVGLVQKNLNPRLEVSAIVLVMYDARTKLADQVVQEVRGHFGERVCRNMIPRTVRLSEAPSFGQPIIAFDSSSRGAIAYRELAKEVSGGPPQRVG